MNSATIPSPRSVLTSLPSTYTGATGSSNVPGSEIPRLACFDSPGPLTTQPITATVIASTPACRVFQAGFGQSQMQRVIAFGGEVAIDGDQVLHPADLRAEDDLIVRQAVALGGLGGPDSARHDGVARHLARVLRLGQAAVLIHHLGQQ